MATESNSGQSAAHFVETTTGVRRSIIKNMSEPLKAIVEKITVTRRLNGRIGFVCPHCSQTLPINEITECDECGAHMELLVRTTVPPVAYNDDDEESDEP